MIKNNLKIGFVLASLVGASSNAWALEFDFYGQINRAMMSVDDGQETESYFVDGSTSSTRVGARGEANINDALSAGIKLESEYQSNASSDVSQLDQSVSPELEERYAELYISGDWGRLSLGQGDGAANGVVERDLSGTMLAHFSMNPTVGGAVQFRDGESFGPPMGATINAQDFEGRYDRLRYDTNLAGGLDFAVSSGVNENDNTHELSSVYLNESTLGTIRATAGYSVRELGGLEGDRDTIGGSLAYLAPNGLNAFVAISNRQDENEYDGQFYYTKLGYRNGAHRFSVDYTRGEDYLMKGDVSQQVGLGYVYQAAKWLELYGLAKKHYLNSDAGDYDDINILMLGSRLKF